jgi:(S)-citramalyl-CoA lyase
MAARVFQTRQHCICDIQWGQHESYIQTMETFMAGLDLLRVVLFTPASHPDRFAHAIKAGADGCVVDLEDDVGLDDKDAARKSVVDWLGARPLSDGPFAWMVRVNHVKTEAGLRDLLALSGSGPDVAGVVLPKSESVSEVEIAAEHLDRAEKRTTFVALIESGRGLDEARKIAAHPQVAAIAFGGADLAADLHSVLEWEPMLFARSRVVQAAAAAGIPAFDVPYLNFHDSDGLKKETQAVKRLGFTCKFAIHPAQIAPIKEIFTPTADELKRAQQIVQAFANAKGAACQVDGKMIDVPVYKAARRVVGLAAL